MKVLVIGNGGREHALAWKAAVIAAADEHGIAMLFTDMRHFRH